MPRKRLYLLLHWIPAMIGIAVILTESTRMMGADNTSRWLLPIWTWLFGPVTSEHWAVIHHWIRKIGHFTGYGLVSLAFFEGWRATFVGKMWNHHRIFVLVTPLALLSTLALASWDEWHQSLLPNRTSSVFDVGIDFGGALVAHLILLFVLVMVWRVRARCAQAADRPVSSRV